LVNVKLVLSLLEALEEFRDMTIAEWDFKEILLEKLSQLLE
jgi:hypothetical protein